MYAIANLETRQVLAYPQGDVRLFAAKEAAVSAAEFYQSKTSHPWAVVEVTAATYGLKRAIF